MDMGTYPTTDDRSDPNVLPAEPQTVETGVQDALEKLTLIMVEMRDDFRKSAQMVDHQQTLLDKLHSENEQLRRAEIERTREPVVRDLISLADTCVRNGRAWLDRQATATDVELVLRQVADDVALILERQGVECFQPDQGSRFDRREARAVRSDPTSDPTLDGTIAEVLKRGYRKDNRVLRYCEVAVWTYFADLDIETPASSDTAGSDAGASSG